MPVKERLRIDRVEEFLLKPRQKEKIRKLLEACFPDYPGEDIYFKQLPSFRYLTYDDNQLVGQIGVDYRMIKNGATISPVLCISDVCVLAAYRSKKIASRMLNQLESDAKKAGIHFVLLVSNESKIYYHMGYRGRENSFRWLVIQNQESLGLAHRILGKEVIMVKKLSKTPWSKELIDLLGPIF